MEGTVTISLKDYEDLKKETGKKDYYLDLAASHIELLEKVEELLKVEGLEPELLGEITVALDEWYG